MSRFYVYALTRPDGTPFYIGKGCGDRIDAHERQAQRGYRTERCAIIRGIWAAGGVVGQTFLMKTNDSKRAMEYETALIRFYGLKTLTNKKLSVAQSRQATIKAPKQVYEPVAMLKVRRSQHQKLVIIATLDRKLVQDVTDEALTEYIQRRGITVTMPAEAAPA